MDEHYKRVYEIIEKCADHLLENKGKVYEISNLVSYFFKLYDRREYLDGSDISRIRVGIFNKVKSLEGVVIVRSGKRFIGVLPQCTQYLKRHSKMDEPEYCYSFYSNLRKSCERCDVEKKPMSIELPSADNKINTENITTDKIKVTSENKEISRNIIDDPEKFLLIHGAKKTKRGTYRGKLSMLMDAMLYGLEIKNWEWVKPKKNLYKFCR